MSLQCGQFASCLTVVRVVHDDRHGLVVPSRPISLSTMRSEIRLNSNRETDGVRGRDTVPGFSIAQLREGGPLQSDAESSHRRESPSPFVTPGNLRRIHTGGPSGKKSQAGIDLTALDGGTQLDRRSPVAFCSPTGYVDNQCIVTHPGRTRDYGHSPLSDHQTDNTPAESREPLSFISR